MFSSEKEIKNGILFLRRLRTGWCPLSTNFPLSREMMFSFFAIFFLITFYFYSTMKGYRVFAGLVDLHEVVQEVEDN